MRKLLFLIILFTACDSSENHGNLSIFNEPSEEQLSKWIEIDSAYINMVQPMVDVYRGSAKLNFNGNPWKNKNFQSKYSDLTWRGLYDYVKYFTELYDNIGYEEGERVLDSLNNRFDQMRDDLIIWKEIED